MTVIAPQDTYGDASVQARVIGTGIHLIDPIDTPLLARWGYDGARGKFGINKNGKRIEIIEDAYPPLATTVPVAGWGAGVIVALPVTDASALTPGMVLDVNGTEQVVISAVDKVANTIGVYARAFGGADGAHLAAEVVSVIGMARMEGMDATFDAVETLTQPFNYTSIFQAGLKMTGTELAIDFEYSEDEFTRQAFKQIKLKNIILEKQIFRGIRAIGTAALPRSMGGLDTFVITNAIPAGGAITKTDVDDLMEAAYGYGANPNLFVCNPAIARDLKDLIDTSSFVRLGQDNTVLGMSAVGRLVTQYGSLEILPDRHCPVATAYALDERKCGMYTLRPWQWTPLGHAGDYKAAELIGEFTLMVANDLAHGRITGLTS